MVDERHPSKRVVKRVVKKTVARPAATSPAAPAPPEPTIRYGRPVATASRTRGADSPASAPKAAVEPKTSAAPKTLTKPRRPTPTIDLKAKVAGAREAGSRAWWFVADGVTDVSRASSTFVLARVRSIAGYRLPRLHPYAASAVTGALVGLLAIALAVASLWLFDSIRGVSSGGGLWGGIAFALVAIVTVVAGEALLRGFGTRSARLKSVLAVILTIVAMLGLFLDVVDGVTGAVLVPMLAVVGYLISQWLVELAENAPAVTD